MAKEVVDPYAGVMCDDVWPAVWESYGEGDPEQEVKQKKTKEAKPLPVKAGKAGKAEQDVLGSGQDELK